MIVFFSELICITCNTMPRQNAFIIAVFLLLSTYLQDGWPAKCPEKEIRRRAYAFIDVSMIHGRWCLSAVCMPYWLCYTLNILTYGQNYGFEIRKKRFLFLQQSVVNSSSFFLITYTAEMSSIVTRFTFKFEFKISTHN